MKEIMQIRELLSDYLMQDARYKESVALGLYRFYESELPYQIAIRMNGSFDQQQFNQRQSISGNIWLDIVIAPSEVDGSREQADEHLTQLCEYLSWFSYVKNGDQSLSIRPATTSSVKNANANQALISYQFKLIRSK